MVIDSRMRTFSVLSFQESRLSSISQSQHRKMHAVICNIAKRRCPQGGSFLCGLLDLVTFHNFSQIFIVLVEKNSVVVVVFFFKLQFLSAFKTKKKQEGILTNS